METNNLSFKKKLSFSGKKVALVIPPSPFLLDERVFVSLGILRVASSLESAGVLVSVLDLSGVSNYEDAVKDYLLQNPSLEWIGLTSTTPQLPSSVNIAKLIRKCAPNLRLVLGGPHVTLTYSAVKVEEKNRILNGRALKASKVLESYFDVLVSGDGEFAVFELFNPHCSKVIDGDDNKGSFFMSNSDYESTPGPARHLVDMQSYKYSIDGFNATSLIAQLGCPFHCGFCGGRNSKSLRLIRTRTTASIISELRWLHENHGYTGFMFYDDELNVNKSFVDLLNEIYKLQKELKTEFRLRGFIKAELFNEEQAIAMVRAGFKWVLCGFEAADPKILLNIDKMATIEDNTNVVKISHKHGLKVKALMSVGHPGETKASILSIRDWLIDSKIDDFDCTVITTYPGTPYYDLAVPNPALGNNVWTYTHKKSGDKLHAIDLDYTVTPDYYKGDPNGGYSAYVFTDHVTSTEIVRLRDIVEMETRKALNISFNSAKPALRYDHSMGQGLPDMIFRASQTTDPEISLINT